MPDPTICPECRAGKCKGCDGLAWDTAADKMVDCGCPRCRTGEGWTCTRCGTDHEHGSPEAGCVDCGFTASDADPLPDPTPLPPIRPGLHTDLAMDDYHARTDWWGSTTLKGALPELYDENAMSQAALDFGTLFHTVVLEPDQLDRYVVGDPAAIGVLADGTAAAKPTATKAWREFVAAAEADGKKIVDQDSWDRAHRMRDAVAAHPEASDLVFGGGRQYETSAFAVDDKGVQHKARPDILIPGAGIVDLKSTGVKPGEDNLTRLVVNYLYDLSAAHYLAVADLLGLDVDTFTWVFVNKAEPYRVTVADADALLIERGRVLRARALERLTNPAVEPYQGASGRLLLTCPLWAAPYESEMEFSA